MVITQYRSKRKATGSRYKSMRGKRQFEQGSLPAMTRLGETKKFSRRKIGGSRKTVLTFTDVANVVDPKTKKTVKAKIKTITDNPANKQLVRRNVITKGAIIDTEKGKARVTSRPAQDGIVNAILLE